MPFLLNHYLHMNCIISKFNIGNEYVTDFAYLTKSSDFWYFVMMEIEDPKKRIFTNDIENVYFHSDFSHARDQIKSWKTYIAKNRESVLKKIDKIRIPLNENEVRFKYVLVYGRNSEKDNSEKRRAMFAQELTDDTRIMTYDSLISMCKKLPYNSEKIILCPWKEQGYKIKLLPNEIETPIFAYIKPEFLKIEKNDIEKLKSQDYQMDEWYSGHMLAYNDKYTAKS